MGLWCEWLGQDIWKLQSSLVLLNSRKVMKKCAATTVSSRYFVILSDMYDWFTCTVPKTQNGYTVFSVENKSKFVISRLKGMNWPSPKRQILDPSKLEEFAEDYFKIDENGQKFSKRVENIVGKGEIAISPFPTVFSKGFCCKHIKTRACLGKG